MGSKGAKTSREGKMAVIYRPDGTFLCATKDIYQAHRILERLSGGYYLKEVVSDN